MALKDRSEADKREILKEARDRFKRCQDWEAVARDRFEDDLKFVEGDSYNGYQWPEDVRTQRESDMAPVLTINQTKQHILNVLNDARQSRVAISIKPTGGEATFESAQLLEGIVRYIEYQSRAGTVYQHALSFAVRAGIGYVRLTTDYLGDDTFDQDIFIRRVKDPRTVYLDPDINEFDGSDATFGFVFTDMPNDQFKRGYPKYKDKAGQNGVSASLGNDAQDWITKDHVRVAEYFRCVPQDDKLIGFTNPQTGQVQVMPQSKMDKELLASVIDDPSTMVRNTILTKVEHFMICGDEIMEEKEWPGRYIPLARCIGEETVIDGELDRKGLTRALLDPQRILNYNGSAAVQYGALQTKAPWVGSAESIEGYEDVWANANIDPTAVLPYNAMDDSGNPLPKPERVVPPTGAPVFMEGINMAAEWMRNASGQYQADMGAPGNERSGTAITARQRQGDNATYHYLDHQSSMVAHIGRMIIDLIPHVWDTQRIVKWRSETGDEMDVNVDPNAPQHVSDKEQTDDQSYQQTLNPTISWKYGVEADVGPAYATKRQEAFAAYTQILAQNKELTGLIGDIAMRFADFPGADEAAQRLRRMVPPQALGEGDDPQVAQLKQQIGEMQKVLQITTQKLADKAGEHQKNQEKNAVDAFKAQTDRVKALQEAWVADPEGVMRLVKAAMDEAIQTSGGILPPSDPNNPPIEPEAPGVVGPDPSAPQGGQGGAAAPIPDPEALTNALTPSAPQPSGAG